jgi:hypothetical protein
MPGKQGNMEIKYIDTAYQAPLDSFPVKDDIYTPFDPIFDADVTTPDIFEGNLEEQDEDDDSEKKPSKVWDLDQISEDEEPVYDGNESPGEQEEGELDPQGERKTED